MWLSIPREDCPEKISDASKNCCAISLFTHLKLCGTMSLIKIKSKTMMNITQKFNRYYSTATHSPIAQKT